MTSFDEAIIRVVTAALIAIAAMTAMLLRQVYSETGQDFPIQHSKRSKSRH